MGNSPEIQSPDNEPDETEVGCSICGGTGLIIEAINGTAYAVPCICVRDGGAGALWRHLNTTPFALTPNPASKRGQLEAVDVETAARLDIAAIAREAEAFYTNFDPDTTFCKCSNYASHVVWPLQTTAQVGEFRHVHEKVSTRLPDDLIASGQEVRDLGFATVVALLHCDVTEPGRA